MCRLLSYIVLPTQPKAATPNYDGLVVIGAGLPRTGTASLRVALEKLLNGRCYHMRQLSEGRNVDKVHWENTLSGNVLDSDWISFLEGQGFRAGVDSPICFYFE